MAYTAQELITNAFYLSNIIARDLETVSGDQLDDGLNRLNAFIAKKDISTKIIPYYSVTEDYFVAGQEMYFIPDLVEIETFAFFLEDNGNPENVRFQMERRTREQYFGYSRAENIQSLPFQWFQERTINGSNIYVYFVPDKAYKYILTGKYSLNNVSLNQDLLLVFDQFYIEYLMYGLAAYLCEWYSIIPPDSVIKELKDLENKIRALSPIDFTMRKKSYFYYPGGLNYGDVNIGKGKRPD